MQDKKQSLVPELRFPGFDGEWEVKKLGEILKNRRVLQKISKKYPLLSFTSDQGVVDGASRNIDRSFLTHDKENKKYLLTKVDDIVYNPANLKFGAIHRNTFKEGVVSPIYVTFEIIGNPYFVETLVTKKTFIQEALKFEEGTVVARQAVSPEDLLSIQVAIPSLPEQQKIAECLSSVDDLIQAETDQLQALKDHKKGLMQQLFPISNEQLAMSNGNPRIPRLRFPGFEGEWEEKKLGEVCNVVDDKCDIGSLTIVTYISTENMLQDFEGVKIASKLPNSGSFTQFNKGDILFSNIRPYLKKVWQAVFDGAASNDVIVFRTLDGYDRLFVSQVIKSDRFIAHSMSGAKGVKMPRGDKKMMLDYLFSIPSLPEQQKIASCLSSLDEGIAAQQEKVEALKEHKKGLMQKLFPTIK